MWLAVLIALLTFSTACTSKHDAGHTAYKIKDLPEAFNNWDACAKAGEAACEYDVGLMYLNGEGRPVDVQKGIDWFSRAAGKGDASSQNKLGLLYLGGKVVMRDYQRAMEYFMAAAKQAYPAAQANIGLMYWKGYGVDVDLVEAFAWSEASTQKLASGAKQRDDILKQLSGDQWAQGRDRATQLKKRYQPPSNFSWIVAIDTTLVILGGIVPLFLLWKVIKAKLLPRFIS